MSDCVLPDRDPPLIIDGGLSSPVSDIDHDRLLHGFVDPTTTAVVASFFTVTHSYAADLFALADV
jgi:hypothetical protein